MFLETPRFPICPSFGFTGGPRYSVSVTELAGGQEQRNGNWSYPRHSWQVSAQQVEDDIKELVEFFHAVGGKRDGFRLKDYADFTATDELIGSADGVTAIYQLRKTYTKGANSQLRPITKPVSGTVTVKLGGSPISEGSAWSLDYATGILTLEGSPTPGGGSPLPALTWSGQFDVPARFDAEQLQVVIENLQIMSVAVPLVEIRV